MSTASSNIDFDPLSPAQRHDPYPVYTALREQVPVFFAQRFGFWVVTRYDDVLEVLKDHTTFSSVGALVSATDEHPEEVRAVLAEGWPAMPVITDTDPPLHDRIRGLVRTAFTPRRVAAMEPRIADIARHLIDGFVDDGRADLIERFAWPLPLRVIGDVLGLPEDDLETLHRWGTDWLALQQPGHSVARRVELARSAVAIQRYFMDVVEERRAHPGDDLVSALVSAADELDDPLPADVVMGVPFDLVLAGHVTVTRAVGNALVLLLERPSLLERLERDDGVVAPLVEEVLRLESPAQGLFRTVTRDVELNGVALPAGAKLMVHFGSANRDPSVFVDPSDADPDRPNLSRHLAFGKGIHFCVGAPLARMELRIALPMLARRLRGMRLAEAAAPRREAIFFARGLSELVLEWNPPAIDQGGSST